MNPELKREIDKLRAENKQMREDLNAVMQYTTTIGGSLEFKKLVQRYAGGLSAFDDLTVGTLKVTTQFGLGASTASPQASISDPSGGMTVDAEARAAINSILNVLDTFGFTS